MKGKTRTIYVRIFLEVSIAWSIGCMYNVYIMEKNFDVVGYPDQQSLQSSAK